MNSSYDLQQRFPNGGARPSRGARRPPKTRFFKGGTLLRNEKGGAGPSGLGTAGLVTFLEEKDTLQS